LEVKLKLDQTFGCAYCGHDTFTFVRTPNGDGTYRAWRKCDACDRNWSGAGKWIPYDKILINRLPIFNPRPIKQEKCAVQNCKDMNTQYHHFYPHHIAGDTGEFSDDWPGAYLCHLHHVKWHHDIEGLELDQRITSEMKRVA